ncbi:MAG: DNA-binding protein [Acidimicrobiales bacterium]|nr:DNA-binding protein [Acidimicrobiales bacterium]
MDYHPDDLDVTTIVRQTGRTERTVRRWLASGQLDSYHLGPRCIRIRRGSYEAFLARHPII